MSDKWSGAAEVRAAHETFALTAMQKGLLAESLLATTNGSNVEQVVWELGYVPDIAPFRAAWQSAVSAFDALRLVFEWPKSSEQPSQRVLSEAELTFREVHAKLASGDPRGFIEDFLQRDREEGFELLAAPLLRVSLLILEPEKAVCVLTIHHCIIDGASYKLVLDHVLASYEARSSKARSEGAPEFRDFLRQRQLHDDTTGVEHFAALLASFVEPTPLPLVNDRADTGGYGPNVTSRLTPAGSALLQERAREAGATPNTFVQLAWALLLSRYTGRSELVFGATWTGRAGTIERATEVVGPFISTLPVRVNLADARTLRGLLSELRQQHLAMRPFTHTSLAEIKAATELAHSPSLFQTLVVFDQQSLQAQLEQLSPAWQRYRVWSRSQTGYPFVLAARLGAELELELELEYDRRLCDAESAGRILADYTRLLNAMAAHLDDSPDALPMLEPSLNAELTTLEAERELVPVRPLAIGRILEQARQRPNALAIRQVDGAEIDYAELERRVTALAGSLRARGVASHVLVAVWLPRSIAGVVALLAVNAAGGAFVPLDVNDPISRVQYVVRDSKVGFLLVDQSTRGRLQEDGVIELDIDALAPEISTLEASTSNPSASPESPAYVIYTSGSTGQPKGVAIAQSALANHLAATLALFELTPRDRVLQFSTPTFDVALEEIVPTLAAGATLVLRNELMVSSARDFFEAVAAERISVINLPTAFWHQLVHAEHLAWPSCLRLVVVGGERPSAESHRKFREADTSHLRWLNAYGPTEATITSTCYDDAERDHDARDIPIGRPLPGVSHFLLDQRLRPVPPGCTGQLYIGGAGLALGYLSREALTAERFLPHPFRPNARLYATGDQARRTRAGNYVYVDRLDHQVKVRGFRVELGEIEAQLRRHPAVTDAVVVPSKQRAGEDLVGFVASDAGQVSEAELREHLSRLLPSHMVPTRIGIFDKLPTTASGKIDRRTLQDWRLEPDQTAPLSSGVVMANDALISALLEIWSEVLQARVTSTSTSFFDLGGHSLLVVRLFTEIEQRLGKTCDVAAFFRNPTLSHLASLLRESVETERVTLITLAPGAATVRPLFLAPGLTGNAVDFVHLVNALSKDVPALALQLNAFQDVERPNETLTDAVKAVVDLMQRVQPHGPYAVAGFSAGGVFAVAIADELGRRGATTDFLGLIDSVPPASVPIPSPLSSPQRILRMSRTVVGRVQEILEQPNALPKLWTRTRAAAVRSFSRWHGAHLNYRPSITEFFDGLPASFSKPYVQSMQRYLDAVVAHSFDRLSVELVLFRTPLDPPEGPYENDLGWGRVTSGHVSVEAVPGRHGELMTVSGSQELAKVLNAYLTRRRAS